MYSTRWQNECFSLNCRKSSPAKTLTKQCVRAKPEKPRNKPSTLTKMMAKSNSGNLDIDENFYGDQDFDMEDFDPEGLIWAVPPHRTLMSKKTINLNGGGRYTSAPLFL